MRAEPRFFASLFGMLRARIRVRSATRRPRRISAMTSFSRRAPWLGAFGGIAPALRGAAMSMLAGGAVALAPHLATAQECATTSDCGDGYRCERYTYESCSSWACADGDPRCPDPVPEPVCENSEYTTCVAA